MSHFYLLPYFISLRSLLPFSLFIYLSILLISHKFLFHSSTSLSPGSGTIHVLYQEGCETVFCFFNYLTIPFLLSLPHCSFTSLWTSIHGCPPSILLLLETNPLSSLSHPSIASHVSFQPAFHTPSIKISTFQKPHLIFSSFHFICRTLPWDYTEAEALHVSALCLHEFHNDGEWSPETMVELLLAPAS